jgi:diguanylate cyclase (GGDEF)-like protein
MRSSAAASVEGSRRAGSIRRWSLWSLHRPGIAYILAVELGAIAFTCTQFVGESATTADMARFVVLLTLAVCYAEATDRVERIKRYLGSDKVWSNHTSVWSVAALIVLPTGLACLLVTLVYGHVLILGRRYQSTRPHRVLLTAAAMVLATGAASMVAGAIDPAQLQSPGLVTALATVSALLVFHLVDLVVLLTGVYLAVRPPSARMLVPSGSVIGFETVTQGLGVVLAELVLFTPWLCPIALVLLAVLHRASLVAQLQVTASTDGKTSLLTAAAWRERAEQALARATGAVAVLLVDIDHFKKVNDRHGHLVGDQVLRAVADCLRGESRAKDIVGRFGGEEFVLLLEGGGTAANAEHIAQRFRRRLNSLELPHQVRVSASVGIALSESARAVPLDALLQEADTALYEAKAQGRDRVRSRSLGPIRAGAAR